MKGMVNEMKWNFAIGVIEEALKYESKVSITYHRKWKKNDVHADTVDQIISYEWNGETVKAVSTYHNVVDGYSYIIDDIRIEKEGD